MIPLSFSACGQAVGQAAIKIPIAFLCTLTISVKASSLVMQFRMRFSAISPHERGETSATHVMVLFAMIAIGSTPCAVFLLISRAMLHKPMFLTRFLR